MMFQTQAKEHSTGIIDLTITFNIGNGEKTDKQTFFEKASCVRYIESSKLTYIKVIFDKFVNHSRILFETGNRDFYGTTGRRHSLDQCIKANEWMQDQKDLVFIAKTILRIEADLRNILPSPSNQSHESSKNRMYDIIVFARNEAVASKTISIKQAAKA